MWKNHPWHCQYLFNVCGRIIPYVTNTSVLKALGKKSSFTVLFAIRTFISVNEFHENFGLTFFRYLDVHFLEFFLSCFFHVIIRRENPYIFFITKVCSYLVCSVLFVCHSAHPCSNTSYECSPCSITTFINCLLLPFT